MGAAENEAIVRRWVDEGCSGGNADLWDQIGDPSYVIHGFPPNFPPGGEGLKLMVRMLHGGMPDFRMTVDDAIAAGDKVAWRFSLGGTHTGGELFGIPVTGRGASATGIVISRFAGGKWAEDHVNWDTLGFFQQLGSFPPAAA